MTINNLEIIHYKALTLLLSGYSTQEVADMTSIEKQTLLRWKKREDFQEMLSNASNKVFEGAVAELVLASKEAALELKKIVIDPNVPAKVKISAISVLLNTAAKCKTWVLERRLEKIEKMLNGETNSAIISGEDSFAGEESSEFSEI